MVDARDVTRGSNFSRDREVGIVVGPPRVELVCRALCRAKGVDPDHEGEPYAPGHKAWELYKVQASEFIAMYEAMQQSVSTG